MHFLGRRRRRTRSLTAFSRNSSTTTSRNCRSTGFSVRCFAQRLLKREEEEEERERWWLDVAAVCETTVKINTKDCAEIRGRGEENVSL